jgi:uncharacterized membrane protein YjfL (UPF0719 family)
MPAGAGRLRRGKVDQFTSVIALQGASVIYYAIDFAMMLGFMAALRVLAGSIAGVSLKDILAKQDNFAVGISLAGAIVAVAVLMMGVVSGDVSGNYIDEVSLMAGYGVLAIVLMWVTRKVFDHIAMPRVSIHDEIMNGNVAAGLIDAGNMVATAIIVRAAMIWVDGTTLLGLAMVIAAYVVSQIILLLATVYRKKVFEMRHAGTLLLGEEIAAGNTALAVRFAGYRLGVGLAVTATSGVVIYDPSLLLLSLAAWTVIAIVMFVAQSVLSIGLRFIFLPGINVGQAVDIQGHLAIGAIEAAVYIGVGFAFVGLLG